MAWFRKTRPNQVPPDILISTRDARQMLKTAKVLEDAFNGDAFKLEPPTPIEVKEEPMDTQDEVIRKLQAVNVSKLPTLVANSVDALKNARSDLQKEIEQFESETARRKEHFKARMEQFNIGIKAWEAAQAVYNEASKAIPVPDGDSPAAGLKKPVRKPNTRRTK